MITLVTQAVQQGPFSVLTPVVAGAASAIVQAIMSAADITGPPNFRLDVSLQWRSRYGLTVGAGGMLKGWWPTAGPTLVRLGDAPTAPGVGAKVPTDATHCFASLTISHPANVGLGIQWYDASGNLL